MRHVAFGAIELATSTTAIESRLYPATKAYVELRATDRAFLIMYVDGGLIA